MAQSLLSNMHECAIHCIGKLRQSIRCCENTMNFNKKELLETLYQRYAMGGNRLSHIRQQSGLILNSLVLEVWSKGPGLLKRGLDMSVTAIMLILLFPLFVFTGLAIKLEDGGPIFFLQTRVGKWGQLFKMYKFRSMRKDAEKALEDLKDRNETGGVIFKIRKDPRITHVGRFIRKFSIDELPQLWNVLKGDMSLVGPRPPLPAEVAKYTYSSRKRLDAMQGITCIWQVSGRSNIDFDNQVKMDVSYIENQSFFGDIKLLFKTIPAVIGGEGAC